MLAAHCVTVDDEEIALLAEHEVVVAHGPRSNGILGCGTAPVTASATAPMVMRMFLFIPRVAGHPHG